MESTRNHVRLSSAEARRLLEKLTDAEIFETFLHTKFIGAKRFSVEGAEGLIPLLDRLVTRAAERDVEEIAIGMAHRGRLNVLANVIGQPAAEIFAKFADEDPNLYLGRGDVKYHLGHSGDVEAAGRKVHLTLSFNPSHLEFVDPVVAGRVRAKGDRRGDAERTRTLPVLVHGDAAFAGQGIVAELFNMSGLPDYRVGGTVHVVVNNQIGFTTLPFESRSTRYATDVAKMLPIPIFHVNGEDPEAVAQVVDLAVEFRQRFRRDVVIDFTCWRKYGHNESDEPSFTQPVMYRAIARHETVRERFAKRLEALGQVTAAQALELAASRKRVLEEQLAAARGKAPRRAPAPEGIWAGYRGGPDADVPDVDTGVPAAELGRLGAAIAAVPNGFTPNPKIARLLAQRAAMGRGERPVDWGMAELLAFGSLVSSGVRVRLSGQDSQRGTFSHRHAVLFDHETGRPYDALAELGGAPFEIVNSPLSEASVLAYEYGYSLETPDGLAIWEAQFGDFVNAAQVIVDQFIASGEDKWRRLSGLVLLLPHGYEGQGPEHSSARMERFLNLCAGDNLQVAYPSTAAQIFHLLRRQALRPFRKPLVVFTPKSLLRLAAAMSPLADLAAGRFRRVIGDARVEPGKVRRVLLCTGKVTFDLEAERQARNADDVAIVRLEQLYPMPFAALAEELGRYPGARELVWVQEEPRNAGARVHVYGELTRSGIAKVPLGYVSRPPAASPATGSAAAHKLEQRRILEAAFAPLAPPNA
jgi:2-oxoglutarate dehydrogenase E1 component